MKPSYEQLTNWCAVHNIALVRDTNGVRATAFDLSMHAITTVLEIVGPVEKLKAAELEAGLRACDSIAEELCILKPSIIHKLNQS